MGSLGLALFPGAIGGMLTLSQLMEGDRFNPRGLEIPAVIGSAILGILAAYVLIRLIDRNLLNKDGEGDEISEQKKNTFIDVVKNLNLSSF